MSVGKFSGAGTDWSILEGKSVLVTGGTGSFGRKLIRALLDNCSPRRIVGIRPGEKLHKVMITEDDAHNTLELADRHIIEPSLAGMLRDAGLLEDESCGAGHGKH